MTKGFRVQRPTDFTVFYFLGIAYSSSIALQASLTGEEEQYITVLLNTQYEQMGKMKFQEMIISGIVVLTAILQTVISATSLANITNTRLV
ncbi:unnamed protein product, partial [Brenthis ino]